MSLAEDERETLLKLADCLIPSSKGRLSATEAHVDNWINDVLQARPDLEKPLSRVLRQGRDKDPADFIEQLRQKKRKLFRTLTEVVAAAYFMNPEVKETIGYHGQVAHPIDESLEVEPSLLQPVLQRGPIYRPTPSRKNN
ncbi:MAG: hypothetical protein AAGG48_21895 [Planctomycetota bacterium]